MLRNVSTVDLSVCVLGEKLSMPICVAATAMQRMAHPDGETAMAKGTQVFLIFLKKEEVSRLCLQCIWNKIILITGVS